MPDLLRKPFGQTGKVYEITPQSAGWRYVGFSLYRLRAGDTVAALTGDDEVILVMVEGKAAIRGAGQDWGTLGQRMSVFEKTAPHCLYLPAGETWQARAETDCVIAACTAPGRGPQPDQGPETEPEARQAQINNPAKRQARRIDPTFTTLMQCGEGSNTRWINNIAMENEEFCDSLLVTEVFTTGGNWSSYPSHRHDEDDFPASPILKKPVITGSIRQAAGRSSVSIRMMAGLMR